MVLKLPMLGRKMLVDVSRFTVSDFALSHRSTDSADFDD